MKWPETVVETPQGPKTAIAPLVISASRATDIPAFHAAWFMNRLRAGYCLWTTPFNARQRQVEVERALPSRLRLATCAESMDLQPLGIAQ